MAETSSAVATPRVKGPLVWLGMDQQELDDAYDQTVYAPNQPLLAKRRAAASEVGVETISAGARRLRPQRA